MAVVTNVILPILAGVTILATIYFGIRAFVVKSRGPRAAYGVGQQEARIRMQVDMIRAAILLIVSLILLGVTGLSFESSTQLLESPATLVSPTDTPMPTATLTILMPAETAVVPSATATNLPVTNVPDTPTPVPIATTATPVPTTDSPTTTTQTATVSSGVGVWLRSAPSVSSEQLEWLLEGTTVTLLPGQDTADEFEWQQVRTADGNDGWVAVPFIVYNQ